MFYVKSFIMKSLPIWNDDFKYESFQKKFIWKVCVFQYVLWRFKAWFDYFDFKAINGV